MTEYKNHCLKEMQARGFIYQCTNIQGLEKYLAKKQCASAYIGFDATASSLQVGNLLQIMRLRLWQKMGYKPIVLIGGGTTKVGDPSGKNAARQMLTEEEIDKNIKGQMKVLRKYLSFGDNHNDAMLVNNSEWLEGLNFLNILREIGPSFSINKMITFDIVRNRLEEKNNISFLEFSYMILQAYDFYHLNRNFDCRIQMGGSDQWANIISGVDLSRRLNKVEVFGITSPLVTNANGVKMGKTAGGAVWLDDNLLSPFDYWQFWRNCDDRDVKKLLLFFTDLTLEEIEDLPFEKDINACKIILATQCTKITHGEEEAQKAQVAAKSFSQGSISENIPKIIIENCQDMSILNLLIVADLCKSKGDAKRLIIGKGAKLNGKIIEFIDYICTKQDLNEKGELTLSFGKKRHVLLSFE